ncbi:MAG: hypothetical protein R2791_02455 [Saprospiraceae bacterium]
MERRRSKKQQVIVCSKFHNGIPLLQEIQADIAHAYIICRTSLALTTKRFSMSIRFCFLVVITVMCLFVSCKQEDDNSDAYYADVFLNDSLISMKASAEFFGSSGNLSLLLKGYNNSGYQRLEVFFTYIPFETGFVLLFDSTGFGNPDKLPVSGLLTLIIDQTLDDYYVLEGPSFVEITGIDKENRWLNINIDCQYYYSGIGAKEDILPDTIHINTSIQKLKYILR